MAGRPQFSDYQAKLRRKKEDRLPLVLELYKKGYSMRQIRAEVMQRLGISSYSLGTVKKDVDGMLKEWRDERIRDTDSLVQIELSRIDDVTREAWDAWDKSKTDFEKKKSSQKGVVADGDGEKDGDGDIVTTELQRRVEEMRCCGDPRYLDIIDKQSKERRKILGLYAPEKQEITGSFSFADFLMKTAIVDENGKPAQPINGFSAGVPIDPTNDNEDVGNEDRREDTGR